MFVAQPVQPWIELAPSQFTHAANGFRVVVRMILPGSPLRAWAKLGFRVVLGKRHEIDLRVFCRRQLHQAELTSSGPLVGDDRDWLRDCGGRA